MRMGGGPRERHTDTLAVALLGATFIVVTLMLGQSLWALRSHQLMVEATLEDFAGFAAEGVAAELNSTFASIFLDQIARGRAAHFAWAAGEEGPDALPPGRWATPAGGIPLHFSIADGRVVPRGGTSDPETEDWILRTVTAHARDIYPRPAPYAVLRTDGPDGQRAVVYRREDYYGEVSTFGFVVRFGAFGPIYDDVLDDALVLPRSLATTAEPEELLTVRLLFPQDGVPFHVRSGPAVSDVVSAEAFAAKAGRMVVQVDLDARRAQSLVPGGGAAGRTPLFVALAALTVGLFGVALALLRRAARLRGMRETFIANVSHDLLTPLAQIRMFAETLLLGRLTDPGERRRSLEIIQQQATNLGDLVDNILHASSEEQAPLRPSSVDLGEVLASTLDGLALSARAKRSHLRGSVDGTAEASIDAAALRRILINLVDNALKYGPPGQSVNVRLQGRGNFVDVVVEDEGPGIPRAERMRVWERFHRLEPEGSSITGTGIGLAVVRDLAERHGGGVRLEETAQRGTRVVVTLASGPATAA